MASVVISWSANCASVWANQAEADDSQKSGSLRATALIDMFVEMSVEASSRHHFGVTSEEVVEYRKRTTSLFDCFTVVYSTPELKTKLRAGKMAPLMVPNKCLVC